MRAIPMLLTAGLLLPFLGAANCSVCDMGGRQCSAERDVVATEREEGLCGHCAGGREAGDAEQDDAAPTDGHACAPLACACSATPVQTAPVAPTITKLTLAPAIHAPLAESPPMLRQTSVRHDESRASRAQAPPRAGVTLILR